MIIFLTKVSEIKEGSTLSIRTMTIVDHETWHSSIGRWWYSEGREQLCDELYKYVSQAILNLILSNDSLLTEVLYKSLDGLKALQITYKDDINVKDFLIFLSSTIENYRIKTNRLAFGVIARRSLVNWDATHPVP